MDFEGVRVVCQNNNLCGDHIVHTNCNVYSYVVHVVNSLLGVDCLWAEYEVDSRQELGSQLEFVEEQKLSEVDVSLLEQQVQVVGRVQGLQAELGLVEVEDKLEEEAATFVGEQESWELGMTDVQLEGTCVAHDVVLDLASWCIQKLCGQIPRICDIVP